jgi:cytochrome P450
MAFVVWQEWSDLPRTGQVILATLALASVLLLFVRRTKTLGAVPLPPGPAGYPLVGSLPTLLPHVKAGTQHLLFADWARQYGDLYAVRLGPFTQYMVNSDVAVKAIFEGKNASISANRPRWIVSNEHICHGWNVLLVNSDTAVWRQQRKVTTAEVGSLTRADAGVPYLEYESLKFLHEVAGQPSIAHDNHQLWQSIMRYTYSAFTSQMFGMDIPDTHSDVIEYIHETGTAQIIGTLPGVNIVEILPFLESLPLALRPWARKGGARFARDVAWCNARANKIANLPESAKNELVRNSLLHKIVTDDKALGFASREQAAYFCLMLTIGAADTSQISTWAFLEAMLRYPEIQRKAQAAIDAVVGDDIPSWSDYDRIPYVRCLVKETWRWRPPVGLGHPHVTTADIEYRGYRIPAGSRIHLNGWAIQHDAARHGKPDDFIPERYEGVDTTVMQSINLADVTKRDHFAFGAGRRICPGYNVAERSLALAIMRILWAFDVKLRPDTKLPLNSLDWRGTFPGLPGSDMPIVMQIRDPRRQAIIGSAMVHADKARPQMVSLRTLPM